MPVYIVRDKAKIRWYISRFADLWQQRNAYSDAYHFLSDTYKILLKRNKKLEAELAVVTAQWKSAQKTNEQLLSKIPEKEKVIVQQGFIDDNFNVTKGQMAAALVKSDKSIVEHVKNILDKIPSVMMTKDELSVQDHDAQVKLQMKKESDYKPHSFHQKNIPPMAFKPGGMVTMLGDPVPKHQDAKNMKIAINAAPGMTDTEFMQLVNDYLLYRNFGVSNYDIENNVCNKTTNFLFRFKCYNTYEHCPEIAYQVSIPTEDLMFKLGF